MRRPEPPATSVNRIRELARSGELRRAGEEARAALQALGRDGSARTRTELHLVAAFCAMRQGNHGDAQRELDAASEAASGPGAPATLTDRVAVWRAELAYFQGRYSAAIDAVEALTGRLETEDPGYAAFALRILMAILLARAEYDAVEAHADRALKLARLSRDPYVLVQVLNILGAVRFDRATSRLQLHARAHLPALGPEDTEQLQDDARAALRWFERARAVAERADYRFAAWYVAGNIERLEILLGHADQAVPAIRKRLKVLQARGARYDEIVTRSNLAWALRTLGRHREALHELEVALDLARATSTFNVLLEFIHYDLSVVHDALGDAAASRASYRRYLRLASPGHESTAPANGGLASAKRPLEPSFLKRADRYVAQHLGEPVGIERLAQACGVSWKTLQRAFADFRGVTPVAHIRNVRLDAAHKALGAGKTTVAEAAAVHGFASVTTFSLEYRRRFGVPPSRTLRRAAALTAG